MRQRLLILNIVLIPVWVGANFSNTASIQYRDPGGILHTVPSNAVVVNVELPTTTTIPILQGFESFNTKLGPQDRLSLIMSGGAPDFVTWTFSARPSNSANIGSRSETLAAPSLVTTAAASLSLGSVAELKPGPWHVRVTATNLAGTSAPTETDFVLVDAVAGANIRLYPNPWRAGTHQSREITFANLPLQSTISIFTVAGRLVKTLSGSNMVTWNLTTDAGERAASGIYIYRLTSPNGESDHGKFVIIN